MRINKLYNHIRKRKCQQVYSELFMQKAALTVEATFIASFINIAIIMSCSFTLGMFYKVEDYTAVCRETAEKDYRIYDLLRLERVVVDMIDFGKEE